MLRNRCAARCGRRSAIRVRFPSCAGFVGVAAVAVVGPAIGAPSLATMVTPDVDLLFTDVVLPEGMDGRRLADEVQRRRPAINVLFTTGYTRNAIVHNGRLDAGLDLIGKPFTFEALAAKVREILDR